jgi:hypothetical protein
MKTSPKHLKRAGPIAALVAVLALVVVPSASPQGQPQYPNTDQDSGSAPDITGVSVASDKTSGQIVFRIAGTNLSTSPNFVTMLNIDSDANPLTGDVLSLGSDYWFAVDNTSYDFQHWNGSDWVETPHSTVTVDGSGSSVLISVNKSELANTSDLNFSVDTLDVANKQWDSAPEDGMFNYSLDAGGPNIVSVDLQTTPSSGPKAGKQFVLAPTALHLPPNGSLFGQVPTPESYTCQATLRGRTLAGTGTGGCSLRLAKKARGKTLKVVLTVTYEGATKALPYTFNVR